MMGTWSMESQRRLRRERGVVFLLALLALLVISAVGAAILYMAAGESGLVGSQRLSAQAYYAGVSGVEEGRYRLLPSNQAATLVGAVPLGLNYTDPSGGSLAGLGGIPIMPCTPSTLVFVTPFPIPAEELGTTVPCNTASTVVFAGPGRTYEALYLVNSAAANPAAPGSDPTQPPSPTNDPFLDAEVSTTATVAAIGSIQPGAGTGGGIPWRWVRVNLKTERSSGNDIDQDGSTADDQPVFLFNNRQYNLDDLVAFDNNVLPPPWGPPFDPNIGKPCAAGSVCATPVYVLTSYSTVPGVNPGHRVVRTEVAAATALGINAAILSDPAVTIQGQSQYIGYDGCDPDCPAGNPPYNPGDWLGAPCAPPPGCNFTSPVQSQDDSGNPAPDNNNSTINGNSTDTYPCPPDPSACQPPPNAVQGSSCIQQNAPFPYDIDELIAQYQVHADTTLDGGPSAFTGATLTASGVIGQFPDGDVNQGTGAVLKTVFVDGDFTCSGTCKGAGILVVDGDFQFTGGFEWWGAIIVRGDAASVGGGSPTSGCNIYGAMLVGGTAALGTTVGGQLCFRYNSCAQKEGFRNRPFQRLSFREIPY